MSTSDYATTLVSLVALLGAWCGWQFLLRPSLLDMWRSYTFELRDSLFSSCAERDLLDHPAHRFIRDLTNKQIRYGYTLSAWTLIFSAGFMSKKVDGKAAELSEVLDLLGGDDRELFDEYVAQLRFFFNLHMMTSSLVFIVSNFLVAVAVILFWIADGSMAGAVAWLNRLFRRLPWVALVESEPAFPR